MKLTNSNRVDNALSILRDELRPFHVPQQLRLVRPPENRELPGIDPGGPVLSGMIDANHAGDLLFRPKITRQPISFHIAHIRTPLDRHR